MRLSPNVAPVEAPPLGATLAQYMAAAIPVVRTSRWRIQDKQVQEGQTFSLWQSGLLEQANDQAVPSGAEQSRPAVAPSTFGTTGPLGWLARAAWLCANAQRLGADPHTFSTFNFQLAIATAVLDLASIFSSVVR